MTSRRVSLKSFVFFHDMVFQPKEGRLAWTHIRNSAIKAFLALDQPAGAADATLLIIEKNLALLRRHDSVGGQNI
jgi:hypothetical protein